MAYISGGFTFARSSPRFLSRKMSLGDFFGSFSIPGSPALYDSRFFSVFRSGVRGELASFYLSDLTVKPGLAPKLLLLPLFKSPKSIDLLLNALLIADASVFEN